MIDKLEHVDFRKVEKFALVDLFVQPAKKNTWGWTGEQDDQLRSMWAAGRSPSEIAIAIGKTLSAVNSRCFTLALERRNRRWAGEENATVAAMFAAGASDEAIALALDMSAEDVSTRRRKLGLKREQPKSPKTAEIVRLRADGVSVREIAGRMRITATRVYQVLSEEKARAA